MPKFESSELFPTRQDTSDREIRNMIHMKQNRIIVAEGSPLTHEGRDGDIQLRITDTGVRLLAKLGGIWHIFAPEVLEDEGESE